MTIVCPRCNSIDVEINSIIDRRHHCRKCGFTSPLFPDVDTTKKKVKSTKRRRR